MSPETQFLHDRRGDAIVPRLLTRADLPWIERVVDEHERYVGRPREQLDRRLREPDPVLGPPRKRQWVARVLTSFFPPQSGASPRPRELRALVFTEAALHGRPRGEVLSVIAERIGVAREAIEAGLFADLGGRRLLGAPEARPAIDDLMLQCNLRLAQTLLYRAHRVRIELVGNSRPVVRHAQLRGLLCEVEAMPEGCRLLISGPFALFRPTRVYGNALASLLPMLPWCERARLDAELVMPDGPGWLRLDQSAPIFPQDRPRRFDSSVEARFAKDFARLAPGWDVLREPEAIALPGGGLLFPDFLLRNRCGSGRWILEIVGFWTPAYLEKKLAAYLRAGLSRLILCIDAERNVGEGETPPGAQVLRYHRKVDAAAVLAVVTGLAGPYPFPSSILRQ